MPATRRSLLPAIGILPVLAAGCGTPAGPAAVAAPDVGEAVDRFLRAFENLDLPAFMEAFAEDATAFFPAPEPPERVDGRAAIRARFAQVFAAIRQSSTGGPPFHVLRAEDLSLQRIDDAAAVATFHLRNAERLARRTLVLRRDGEGWRIVHLHASNVAAHA